MPEGHTIHRIALDHTPLLTGRTIEVSSPQGRFSEAAARVDGRVLESIEAYGKHLFHWWSTGEVGHVHLGLFGKFRVQRGESEPAVRGQVRARFRSEAATIDLSGPTACTIGTPDDRDAIVARLGPDPLRTDADPQRAIDRIRRSRQAIGALLLDQSVLAGVGNVYRAEALFVHGIHPARLGNSLDVAELESLWATIRTMLEAGVKANRIVTVDRTLLPAGRRPKRGESTYVYHRPNCLQCGAPTATATLGARPCWFCPNCQPA